MVIGNSLLKKDIDYDFALKKVKVKCFVCKKEFDVTISSVIDEKRIKIKCLDCERDNNLLKELGV